jgi:hypothetical protein
LGKLYQAVKIKGSQHKVVEKEYKYCVKLDYKLLPWILKDENSVDQNILRWLNEAYSEIVYPMTVAMRNLF